MSTETIHAIITQKRIHQPYQYEITNEDGTKLGTATADYNQMEKTFFPQVDAILRLDGCSEYHINMCPFKKTNAQPLYPIFKDGEEVGSFVESTLTLPGNAFTFCASTSEDADFILVSNKETRASVKCISSNSDIYKKSAIHANDEQALIAACLGILVSEATYDYNEKATRYDIIQKTQAEQFFGSADAAKQAARAERWPNIVIGILAFAIAAVTVLTQQQRIQALAMAIGDNKATAAIMVMFFMAAGIWIFLWPLANKHIKKRCTEPIEAELIDILKVPGKTYYYYVFKYSVGGKEYIYQSHRHARASTNYKRRFGDIGDITHVFYDPLCPIHLYFPMASPGLPCSLIGLAFIAAALLMLLVA